MAAREAEAARAARRERAEELFEERLKRVPTHQMDPRIAELARGSARPRLELGLLLHRMMERRGFIELGLPTFWAYAKERVSQGTRWANDARRLARVLCDGPGLPLVAGALEQGVISWSMAWVVATYLQKFAGTLGVEASLEAEQRAVLELVRGTTVRKAKELLAERLEGSRPRVSDEEAPAEVQATNPQDEDDEEYRRLERTVPLHEAWLIEDVRLLFNALVHHEANDGLFIDSVVAEAMSSIGMASDENGEALRRIQWDAAKRRILLARDGCERARKRVEREVLAERRLRNCSTSSRRWPTGRPPSRRSSGARCPVRRGRSTPRSSGYAASSSWPSSTFARCGSSSTGAVAGGGTALRRVVSTRGSDWGSVGRRRASCERGGRRFGGVRSCTTP